MFCGECGAKNIEGSRFCESCGKPLEAPDFGTTPSQQSPPVSPPSSPVPGSEQVISVIPYLEQGTLFLDKFTLIVTSARLIFAKVPATLAGKMDEKAEKIDDGWVEFDDLPKQRTYLNGRNWADGPWRVYSGMNPDAIASESPKNISVPLADIEEATVFVDHETDFADEIDILTSSKELLFTLNYGAGERVVPVLKPLLGERLVEGEKK